jgi:hypothetical protein
VVARAAGARITGADGAEYDLRLDEDETRRELLGTNGVVHEAVLAHLNRAAVDLADAETDD